MLGLDCLGLAKFPPKAVEAIPAGFALGVFANEFGDSSGAVSGVIGRCKALRVHLHWSPTHSYPNADKKTLEKEAARWSKLAKGVSLYISPFCEHNLTDPDPYLHAVKEGAPDCEPVNSVWKGALSHKYTNEVHSTEAKAPGGKYIFSYDGSDIFDSRVQDIKTRHKSAVIWFAWTSRFNGHKTASARSDHSSWPTDKTIQSVVHLMKNEKGMTRVPHRATWISHSKGVPAGGQGSDQPMLITQVKAKAARLISLNRVAATGTYAGLHHDGRHRYQFGEWGFEIAERTGNIALELDLDGKTYAAVHPAFSDGDPE